MNQLEVFPSTVKLEREIKGFGVQEEEIELSPLTGDAILHTETPKVNQKNKPQPCETDVDFSGYNVNQEGCGGDLAVLSSTPLNTRMIWLTWPVRWVPPSSLTTPRVLSEYSLPPQRPRVCKWLQTLLRAPNKLPEPTYKNQ